MMSQSSHVARPTNNKAARFERFDGCRFAVVFPQISGKLVGTATFERDDLLGNVLRIPIEAKSPGNPQILLAEDEWGELITPDSKYGCDYCVVLLQEN